MSRSAASARSDSAACDATSSGHRRLLVAVGCGARVGHRLRRSGGVERVQAGEQGRGERVLVARRARDAPQPDGPVVGLGRPDRVARVRAGLVGVDAQDAPRLADRRLRACRGAQLGRRDAARELRRDRDRHGAGEDQQRVDRPPPPVQHRAGAGHDERERGHPQRRLRRQQQRTAPVARADDPLRAQLGTVTGIGKHLDAHSESVRTTRAARHGCGRQYDPVTASMSAAMVASPVSGALTTSRRWRRPSTTAELRWNRPSARRRSRMAS